MDKPITFGDLDATLRSFGFEVSEAQGKYRLYRHVERDAVISLPYQPFDAEAPFFSWGSVRGTLADFGFIKRDDFFEVVHSQGRVAS